MVPTDTRRKTRAHPERARLQLKIIQTLKTRYDVAERRRNRGLAGIGKMPVTLDDITVHLCVQRRFDLLRRASEGDHVLAGGYAFDVKTRALQPCRHFVNIALA